MILGLGNTIRGDDGIGIYVVRYLENKFSDIADLIPTEEMGLSLLDYLSPYKKAVIIDSFYTGKNDIGEVYVFENKSFFSGFIRSNHYIGIPELMVMARKLKLPFPHKVLIIGISVEDPFTLRPDLSENLKKKIPSILKEVEYLIHDFLK